MLFNSYVFWVFLGIVLALYRVLDHRGQNRMLLIASYVFYGWWDWRFLSLVVASTVVDYCASIGIHESESPRRRRWLMVLSACTNLGLLGFFKYYGFFAHELSDMLHVFGMDVSLQLLHVVLPVGISFYTFQTMSYTIDVYRGHTKPTKNFLDFALYVCFFPQLVAGPIERSERLLPQVLNARSRRSGDFQEGLCHIVHGLFKKVVIADNLAPIVNTIFGTDTADLTGAECLVGVYAFAFQIYGDFSGYSSIAQGVSRWLGFDLMTNFKVPYLSATPSEFWRRWHISLSTWLRDYLYITVGGNRGGRVKTYRNLMLTMLLGGLWHGAGWTFIAWGGFHGLLLCVYRVFERRKTNRESVRAPLVIRMVKVFVLFHLVCIGWLLFRAESIQQAWDMAVLMFTDFRITPFATSAFCMLVFYAGPLVAYEFWLYRADDMLALVRSHWLVRAGAYGYCSTMILFFPAQIANAFIYFQF